MTPRRWRFFSRRIMQGSHLGLALHGRDYRGRLEKLLSDQFPYAEIYDPLPDHGDSQAYGEVRPLRWQHFTKAPTIARPARVGR